MKKIPCGFYPNNLNGLPINKKGLNLKRILKAKTLIDLGEPMNERIALAICHTLSQPGKMPCKAYSLPARKCLTGGKLQKVPGSVCFVCYALRNSYNYPSTQKAMARRLKSLSHPLWADAIAYLIKADGNPFFRWHDSGDIQSVEHLEKIVRVAHLCPKVSFWLPTREPGILSAFLKGGGIIPENLTIRLSAFMVNAPAPEKLAESLGAVSSVVTTGAGNCNAPRQGGKCLDCRKCWDKKEKVISYEQH